MSEHSINSKTTRAKELIGQSRVLAHDSREAPFASNASKLAMGRASAKRLTKGIAMLAEEANKEREEGTTRTTGK